MAKVPECVVCLQQFDDFRHIPRVLVCGHSFCELCLMQLQSAWLPSVTKTRTTLPEGAGAALIGGQGGGGLGAVIRCPECSHRTRLPVGGQQSLPKNVALLRLLPSLIADEADFSAGGEVVEGDDGKKMAGGTSLASEGNGIVRKATDEGGGRGQVQSSSGKRSLEAARKLLRHGKEMENSEGAGRAGVASISNCSRMGGVAVVGGSSSRCGWAVPCNVFSGNVKEDVRNWVIPKGAVKLTDEVDASNSVHDSSVSSNLLLREVLRGEVTLERDLTSSPAGCLSVSLVPIEIVVGCSRSSKNNGGICGVAQVESVVSEVVYEESVVQAWNGLRRWVKTELLLLFRISMVSHRVCTFLGLWMKNEVLYLVSQSSSHRSVPPPENSVVTENEAFPKYHGDDGSVSEDQKQDTKKGPSASRGLNDLDFSSRILGGQLSTAARVEEWSRHGASICELLHDVHSQGLIFGMIGPRCFTTDMFGNLLLDMNSALFERFRLQEAVGVLVGWRKMGSLGSGDTVIGGKQALKAENCLQYMSPEVLSLLGRLQEVDGNSEGGEDESSSREASDIASQGRLSFKADVWSLGCLLLELATGRPPYGEISLSDFEQRVCINQEKPQSLSSAGRSEGQDARDKIRGDQELPSHTIEMLSKCFEFDPDLRPDIEDLWLGITAVLSRDSDLQEKRAGRIYAQPHAGADLKQWMLVLSGFVRDGCQEHDVEDPHRQLGPLLPEDGFTDINNSNNNTKEMRVGLVEKGLLEGHRDYVTALVVCEDSLLSTSFDKTINVWSLEDHTLLKTLKGHAHIITSLAVDQETHRCFSGDNDASICAWTLDGGAYDSKAPIASWKVHNDWRYTGVTALAVSADGMLYSGSGDKTIRAWSLLNFDLLGTMEGHNGPVSALLVDGQVLYSGSWDGTIRAWWRDNHSCIAVLGFSGPAVDPVRTLCMSDSFLFAGRETGVVQVWRDEECLTTVTAHNNLVSTLYVEGDFLYTGSWDQQIKAWKVDEILSDPSPTIVRNCNAALTSIVSDGDRLYVGLSDSAIKVYTLLGDTWASLVQMLNP